MAHLLSDQLSPLALLAILAGLCIIGGLLPFSPMEAIIVGLCVAVPAPLLLPVLAVATVAQMSSKVLLYAGSRAGRRALGERHKKAFDRASSKLTGKRSLRIATTFGSAVVGLPPFYFLTVAYGALRLPIGEYVVAGTAGRVIRLVAMVMMGRVFVPATAAAQAPVSPKTYVLVPGTLGGVAAFTRLEAALVERGHRVIKIDPFRISADSTDMSFAAMARRVERVLDAQDIRDAHVVAHSHGGGVMLRLAANAPHRVAQLTLISVGAQEMKTSTQLALALRLAPIIAKVPGGRGLMRRRLIDALRQNSGSLEWLTAETQRAYVEPLVDSVGRATGIGRRMLASTEPEPVDSVVARLRVPLQVILGEVPHPAGPPASELTALEPLGAQARVIRLAGVGFFAHEEAPQIVVGLVDAPVVVATTAAGGRRNP